MIDSAPRKSLRGRLFLALVPMVLPLVLPFVLADCALPGAPPPGSPEAQEQHGLVVACRRRADEAYDVTHRDQIYAPASQVNTPFSANYQPGIPDRGLSDLFERDRMVSDCVRNTGADGNRMPPGDSSGPTPDAMAPMAPGVPPPMSAGGPPPMAPGGLPPIAPGGLPPAPSPSALAVPPPGAPLPLPGSAVQR